MQLRKTIYGEYMFICIYMRVFHFVGRGTRRQLTASAHDQFESKPALAHVRADGTGRREPQRVVAAPGTVDGPNGVTSRESTARMDHTRGVWTVSNSTFCTCFAARLNDLLSLVMGRTQPHISQFPGETLQVLRCVHGSAVPSGFLGWTMYALAYFG